MFPPIFATCKASAAVTTLLGTNPVRLYPFGEAPQGGPRPYAVWQEIGGLPENYLGQVPDTDQLSLQVDVYADTVDSARAVRDVLRDAIEPVAHIVGWRGDGREPDTNLYRLSFDVDWYVDR